MNPISYDDNTKKVLRIALVGVRPADQVILKGYLRLLMRLEADLEWVSANHENVDLFMINNEFQQAESVQRLLAVHPYSSVIYIARTENENGFLFGDLLTLPIKDLDPLNQWLYANLRMLAGKTAPKTNLTADNQPSAEPITPAKRQSLDDVIANRQNQAFQQPQNLAQPKGLDIGVSIDPNHIDKTIATAIAKIISRLNKKEDQLFSLNDKNGAFLAYIQPKQQRIWQLKPLTEVGEWTLNIANPTALNANDAEDLVQFLWKIALNSTKYLEPLFSHDNKYRITSWVKPDNNNQRHNVLKAQCVLEVRPVSLNEISQLSQIDEKTLKPLVIALIVAGLMEKSTYQMLEKTVQDFSQQTESVMLNNHYPQVPTPVVAMPTHQSTTTLRQEINIEQPTVKKEENNQGMKGFLSRLRSKLGI